MSTDRTLGGLPLPECDHWLVFSETPSSFDAMTRVHVTVQGVPSVSMLDERLGEKPRDITHLAQRLRRVLRRTPGESPGNIGQASIERKWRTAT